MLSGDIYAAGRGKGALFISQRIDADDEDVGVDDVDADDNDLQS